MLSCKQTSQLLSQSLDRGLSRRERANVYLHLMFCSMCRRFGVQIRGIRAMVRRFRQRIEQDQTLRLPTEAQQRIAHAIESKRK